MIATHTDADVIESSLAAPEQFAAIFDRHFDAIYWYLGRRVGCDRAEELAAETFTQAFATRRRYAQNRPDARPWLYGIASNLLSKHYRSEERQLRAYARTGVDPVQEIDIEAVVGQADAAAMGPLLAEALAALKRGDRDVLLLSVWAGLAYEQIADALLIPVGTVRSRLHRARHSIRDHLARHGYHPTTEDTATP